MNVFPHLAHLVGAGASVGVRSSMRAVWVLGTSIVCPGATGRASRKATEFASS